MTISNPKLYDLILSPVITEKATIAGEQSKVTFKVKPEASKEDIKAAVEQIFKVKVEDVNTITIKGKKKRNRLGGMGKRSDIKKAIVKLENGKTIDLAAGV